MRTWNPDEVVDLAIGESGIEAEKPVTVGQLFKNVVARFPIHPALKYKEDGMWKTITYTEYYGLCIKAAKSFLKVRVGATYLNRTVGLFFVEENCLNFAFLVIHRYVTHTDVHDM